MSTKPIQLVAAMIGISTLPASALGPVRGPQEGCHPPIVYPTLPDSIAGDCDLDGDVDQDDLDIWAMSVIDPPGPYDPVSPRQGDVNWDRLVDIDDLAIILANWGQSLTPIPPMHGVNIDTTVSGLNISMLDNDTGMVLKAPSPIYSTVDWWAPPAAHGGPGSDLDSNGRVDIIPATDVQIIGFVEFTDGFDATLRITNSHTDIRAAGRIMFDQIRFGVDAGSGGTIPGTATIRRMQRGGAAHEVGEDYSVRVYPGTAYSPAQVLEANGYTIGLSVAYPVLEYQHTVAFMSTRGSQAGNPWTVFCHPNMYNTNGNGVLLGAYNQAANFQPGETRDYQISVRVQEPYECDHDNEWLRTLRPYRRYFRALYGPVRYKPDHQPVLGRMIAYTNHITGSNPYGFYAPSTHRIDTFGWGPWLADFNASAASGWGRTMVWSPTGLYTTNQNNNYPPQFTSQWDAMGAVANPPLLAGYDNSADKNLGLWWGRSAQVADQWDDPTLETLDRSNPVHRAFAMNEMDGAIEVNARTIGLDAFARMRGWNGYDWVQDLQDAYPGLRFITEPDHSDFVHTVAPNWTVMTKDPGGTGGELYKFDQGTIIQDFINPGHETWGQVESRFIKTYFGHNQGQAPSLAEVTQILNEVGALNLVPCYFGSVLPVRTPTDFVATDTQADNVPADLR